MRPSTFYFFLFGFCASLLLPSFWEHFNLKIVSFFIFCIVCFVFLFFTRALYLKKETIVFRATFLFLLGLLLATIRLDILLSRYDKEKEAIISYIGKEVLLEGIVLGQPKETEKSRRLTVTVLSIEGKALEKNPKILVITDLFSEVSRGEKISFLGRLIPPESFIEEGETVHWPKILAREGIFYQSTFPRSLVMGESSHFFTFNSLYNNAVLSLATLLPLPERALSQGILLGKNFSDRVLTTSFRQAGLSHIVVLSGFNLVIIIRGLLALAPLIGRKRALLFGVMGIFIFLFSVGPEPPLLRATVMTLAVVLAEIIGRPNTGSRILYVAFFILLLCNPILLSSNLSFQLSFLATAGIIYLEPYIHNYINKKNNFLLSIISTTLAAQLAVLPLLLFTFASFSPYFLIANVLTLPVIPVIMFLGILVLVVSFVSVSLAALLAWPLYSLLKYVLLVASSISVLPGATLVLPNFSVFFLLLLYGLFFGFFIYRDEFFQNITVAR